MVHRVDPWDAHGSPWVAHEPMGHPWVIVLAYVSPMAFPRVWPMFLPWVRHGPRMGLWYRTMSRSWISHELLYSGGPWVAHGTPM